MHYYPSIFFKSSIVIIGSTVLIILSFLYFHLKFSSKIWLLEKLFSFSKDFLKIIIHKFKIQFCRNCCFLVLPACLFFELVVLRLGLSLLLLNCYRKQWKQMILIGLRKNNDQCKKTHALIFLTDGVSILGKILLIYCNN